MTIKVTSFFLFTNEPMNLQVCMKRVLKLKIEGKKTLTCGVHMITNRTPSKSLMHSHSSRAIRRIFYGQDFLAVYKQGPSAVPGKGFHQVILA